MIGQVRFAWISFKRSFLASFFSFISQIVTYTAITISIAIFSITKPFLYRAISQIYYKSYISMGILFIVVGIIIGGVVTSRSIDLKFQSQREDIAIMKNVGGKNKWIYSYFIFNQILTAIIMLVLGMILALTILGIIFSSFGFGYLFSNIRFVPVLIANIAILIVSYLKSHYTILKFISEKNFEVSSSKLSGYKSIFEFRALLNKFKTVTKIAGKNYLRSGKILASFLFSFFLAFSIISFALGPVAIAETYTYHYNTRFSNSTYVIGPQAIVDFYSLNLGIEENNNTPYTGDLAYDIDFFKSNNIDETFLNNIEGLGIEFVELFLTKLKVQEIQGTEIIDGNYSQIGFNRTFHATVIGYRNMQIAENLFLRGSMPGSMEVLIGDSLDQTIFEDSSLQEIKLTESSSKYDISGVIIDPFSSGFSVYLPIGRLNAMGIGNGTNLVTLGELNSTTYSSVESIVGSFGYTIERVDEIVEERTKEYRIFTFMYDALGLSLFLIFSFQIIVFSFLYFLTYKKDYELLYKLGIEKRKISKINLRSILLHLIPGVLFGSYFGSIVTRYFLVPYTRLGYYLAFLFGAIVWFILIAYVGAIMSSKRGIKEIYNAFYKIKK